MNDMVKINIPSLTMSETELITVLQGSLYPGAKHESIKLVIGYCRAGGFDPMQKPVHIVPMSVKTGKKKGDSKYDEYEMRDVIMPGVGLYRTLAARTGEYAGMSDAEFGPSKTLTYRATEWVDGPHDKRVPKHYDATLDYPEWCRIVVRRMVQGRIVEFAAKEYWMENYATAGKDTSAPNAMWKKRPFGQLAKCAEAQALRKGFPEAGSEPTVEEMAGKSIDDGVVTIDHGTGEITQRPQQIATPQSKSAAPAADAPHAQEDDETSSAPGNAPAKSNGGQADSAPVPASAAQLKNIGSKIKALAAIKEVDEETATKMCLDAHKLESLAGITVAVGNEILTWISAKSKE